MMPRVDRKPVQQERPQRHRALRLGLRQELYLQRQERHRVQHLELRRERQLRQERPRRHLGLHPVLRRVPHLQLQLHRLFRRLLHHDRSAIVRRGPAYRLQSSE